MFALRALPEQPEEQTSKTTDHHARDERSDALSSPRVPSLGPDAVTTEDNLLR